MKRRQFTTSVAALAGLSATSGATATAVRQVAGSAPDNNLMARQRFEERLGQRFMATGCAETRLRLNAVKSAVTGREQEQFHVLFSAPPGQTLPEGIYLLERGGKSEFGLHLIPNEVIDGRQQMTATINLHKAA